MDFTSSDISVHASAAEMQAALEAIPTVGAVAVRLTSDESATGFGHVWIIRFLSFDSDVPSLEVSTDGGLSWGIERSGIGSWQRADGFQPAGASILIEEVARGIDGFEQQDITVVNAVGGSF